MSCHGVIPALTDEWVELWEESKHERPVSPFFRFAKWGHLPEGVDPDDDRVVAAVAEIKAAMSEDT